MVERATPQTADKDIAGWATPETPEKVFHRKTRKIDRARMVEKSLFLLWWPAFLGSCIVATYGLRYWQHSLLAHTVLVLSAVIASIMLLTAFNGGWAGRASATFLAVNGFCMVFVGLVSVFLGVYCFQSYTKSYEIYRGSRYYENVVPNINPGAHRDGGVINFAAGSRVDVEHSIGIRNGDFYCAAPIVFPDSNGFSGFWAAGMNCCNARGGFRCGEVSELQVRSGLTVLDEDLFTPEEIPQYMKAAAEAAAQFGIGIPTKPMFVRWSGDVDLDKDRYYHDAVGFVTSSVAGLFCFMLVIVVMLSSAAMGSSDGFANDYYSVDTEVNQSGDIDPSMSSKKMRKARRTPDPFMDNC